MSRRQRSPPPADDRNIRQRVNWELYDPNVMRMMFQYREELEFHHCIEKIVTTMKKVFRGFVLDAENEQKETIHETFNHNYQNDEEFRWLDLTTDDDELFYIGTIYGSYTIKCTVYVYTGNLEEDVEDLELVKSVITQLMDNILRSSTQEQ
jgi:hypothetical protein